MIGIIFLISGSILLISGMFGSVLATIHKPPKIKEEMISGIAFVIGFILICLGEVT